MKNGCDEISEARNAELSDRVKKQYRYVSDLARRVDDATVSSHTITDLFTNSIEAKRQKLRDNCEKLLFLDPLNHGKKSIELLWRKVYYDTVSTAKKLRETDPDNDCYLLTHIVGGMGHFHNIITRIQSDLKVIIKELDYPLLQDEELEKNCTPTDEEMQFGRSALHSCLIYLGDLARYQAEVFPTFDPSIAARYYLQAAHIDMSSGMPYNQLGNLYLDKNYNLNSVCYYIHCLSCATPFEGAMDNLTKIFDKITQFTEAINDPDTLTQSEHMQNTVANFLSLIEIWYLNKNDTNIPQRCNTIAQELKIAMEFTKTPLPDINKNYEEYTQAVEEENTNPSYLNGNIVHNIVQICLFTIAKVNEIDEQKAFACKAFTLALLSQLLQKLLKQLQSFGLKNPAESYKPRARLSECEKENIELSVETENGSDIDPEHMTNGKDEKHEELTKENVLDEDANKHNGDSKASKRSLAKRRRRRRVLSSGSSEMSDEDSESSEVEEYCSDEELSNSSYQSDDQSKSEGSLYDGTDTEETNEKANGDASEKVTNPLDRNKFTNVELEKNKPTTKESKSELNADEIQNFLLGNNFLPSIKLLLDWVLSERDLIISCGDSGESLFQCVVDLLNIFSFHFKNNESQDNVSCQVLEYVKRVTKNLKLEYKIIPLPEDINLRGTNICKFDKDAAEWQILDKYKPTVYEENVIRILNFISFGNQIAKIVPYIRYNRSMKIFYLKKAPRPKVNTKINHKRSREWHNSKKPHVENGEGGLLRRLGRLWLASRVRELERSGQASVPALLALDASALHVHLRHVKQLLRSKNYILLVPTIVVQELDDLKRDRSTARDAIRWLEAQLKSGSRFLRAQRPGQSKPLPLLKYPRKAPPHVHNFIKILEFCNHFIGDEKQGGNGDPDNSFQGKSVPLLILLVGNDPSKDEEPYKEFSLTGAAQASGISVEYIGDFYSKWRQAMHKSSKKR